MPSSDCRHCWHRSEETHGVICCWCGFATKAAEAVHRHGPFHPVMVAQEN